MQAATLKPYLMGTGVIGLTLPLHLFLPLDISVQVAAVLLALIAGAYIGFGAADGRMSAFATEFVGAGTFGVAAFLGLIWQPWVIAVGIFAHAFWDFLHHNDLFGARIPKWYIPFCVWIDVAVGTGLLIIWYAL
ncbi:MAG: hypothetical protein AAGJ85_04010 [Pseudomonadota bacterium]